jgi:membrane protease YdiL (CAAX protease family)
VAGDRLTGSDKRALLFWVVLGILSALFAQKYFFRAFPEASVNFQVSREEALKRAQSFVTGLGENIAGYQSAIVFDVDENENAKVYLERELGLQEANRLMSSELNIWFWNVRFFKPMQEEEFRVRVSPAGKIVGYEHKIEESRSGAALDRAAAQSAAQSFLSARLGLGLTAWDLLPEEANSNKRPNRLDWSFTWEKHGFRAKEAPYRLQVTLLGDKIGSSEESLHVPEAWQRGYERLRSGNNTLALAFILPYVALLGIAIYLGIQFTKSGKTVWGPAIKLGVLAAIFLFLQALNDWPLWGAQYDTKVAYSGFILQQIARAILVAVVTALTITLVLPAAEPLYRSSQPEHLSLRRVFTVRGLRSKEFFSASIVGLSLAAAHVGFLVAFYLVATWLGAWAPQELNYSDSVNTLFPWISGFAIGLLASLNEEFTFRLFAIPFLLRFTRSRWIAVIVPAFLWSFLHSNYPQEPAYIRGIEIGIIGIVAGIVMLRWGIIATLIWHYTVDALLVGLLLIRSNSLYFKISGLIVAAAALAPLAFACVSYVTRGRFETDEDLLNRSQPDPEIDPTSEPAAESFETKASGYEALSLRRIAFLVICLLAGSALICRLNPQSIGEYLKLSVHAKTARMHADQILRQRGLDPNSYYHATVFVDITDPVVNEFLRERIGIAGTNAVYDTRVPGALWRVRYFRDSQREEFAVILRPDGWLHSVRHILAEEASGASLTKEEAVARAEKFLREEKKLDLKEWTLVEPSSKKKPHRLDHTLIWQQNEPLDLSSPSTASNTDHAYARVYLQVLGDEVTNYDAYVKIPEDWRRKHEEFSLSRTIFSYVIPTLFFLGLGSTMLILYLRNLKSEAARSIPWRRIGFWSLGGLIGFVAVFALGNRIAVFLNIYDTAISLKMWFGIIAIGALFGVLLNFGRVAILFGIAWYFAYRSFGVARMPSGSRLPAEYFRDALWIGLGGAAGLLGLGRLLAAASNYWPTVHRSLPASFGQEFDAIFPAASILGGTLIHGLFMTGIAVAVASFVAAHVRQPVLRISLLVGGALALTGGGWGSPADLGKQFLGRLILLSVLVFGVQRLMRFNILGCFLVVASTSLVSGAAELLGQPDSFYRGNGYAVLLALVLLFAWPLVAWRLRARASPA